MAAVTRVLRVTAEMSTAVITDDEIHLDALLLAAVPKRGGPAIKRHTRPGEIPEARIPVMRVAIGEHRIPLATAAEPERIFGSEVVHKVRGPDAIDPAYWSEKVSVATGASRRLLLTGQALLVGRLAWLVTTGLTPSKMRRLLARGVPSIGKWRKDGWGRVRSWSAELADEPALRCWVSGGGLAARHLPAAACASSAEEDRGPVCPPYWLSANRVPRVPAGSECQLSDYAEARLAEIG